MKIGHTGITWGIPGDVEQAYRDTAELGYQGFETFATSILEWNEKPGGYRALADRYGIPTAAAYCHKEWIDPARSEVDLDEAKREADALRALPGAATFVVQGGARPAGGYDDLQFGRLADSLNKVGRHCAGVGLKVGLHPHTETAIETRDDIDRIFALLDPDLVGFAPDTGQIAKGGSDILEVMRTYRDRIVHVHLKDWNGKPGHDPDLSGYLNYEPIGDGVLDITALLDILQLPAGFDGWVNVELDPTDKAPWPPREAAARSRRSLGRLVGERHFRMPV